MPRAFTLAVLIALLVVAGNPTAAQTPPGGIEERVLIDNDSVRLVLITYPPGADSDLHLNLGPEVTIVQEGELVVFAGARREVLGPGAAHWLPDATVHLARNETDRPTRFWSLLLKRCD
ncbi:MAG TPA: cupin domain-containing protein [Methylomirabilota bacterium]|nr:cupin domain-containing protein [Methylomirabilota bacterium]